MAIFTCSKVEVDEKDRAKSKEENSVNCLWIIYAIDPGERWNKYLF